MIRNAALLFVVVTSQERKPFAAAVPHVVLLLTRLAISNTCTVDYLYYSTPSPWLQVKLLQFLQLYPVPSDATHRAYVLAAAAGCLPCSPPRFVLLCRRLNDVLTKIISHTDVTKSVNKNNADHSVLFEALNLLIHHGTALLLLLLLLVLPLVAQCPLCHPQATPHLSHCERQPWAC